MPSPPVGLAAARAPAADLFVGGGEMGALMRSMDWSKTKLGPVEDWPKSLRTMQGVVLGSRFPMLLWWGPDLLHLYNDAYRALLGDKHPAALAAPAAEVWAEIWDVVGSMARGVQQGGPATWTEDLQLFINSRCLAEETYFTFSYSPVPSDDGRVGGVLGTVQETTAKVQNDRQIRMLHSLSGSAAEAQSVDDAYRIIAEVLAANELDLPFAFLFVVNEKADEAQLVAASGWKDYEGPAKLVRVPIAEHVGPTSWPFAEAIRTSHAVIVDHLSERFGPLPQGRWNKRPESAIVLPLFRAGRSPPYAFLVAGISPHRLLDERYREFFRALADQVMSVIASARAWEAEKRRAEALADIDRAKTTFFSNVSHELRTPLTLILGPVEDALAQSVKALHGESLEAVHRSALRLLRLVNSLLDFARIEAGRVQGTFVPTDLSTLTAGLASSFRSLIEQAGLRLVIDCPPIREPVFVDPVQWEKIVFNLMSNAFKFTFRGAITVALRCQHGRVDLSVRDTGTGIPAHELEHLFERFHRVRGARGRSFEGTGIGLSFVQELAKLHGGTVHASSVEGEGSTFTVSIPIGRAHLPEERVGRGRAKVDISSGVEPYLVEASQWSSGVEASPPPRGAPEHRLSADAGVILIVDDNADMRRYLVRLLRPRYDVESVGDGYAALAAARARTPDLVLTDVMMPGLDGFGLLRALRADPKTSMVPVVLLSARAGEEAVLEGLDTGADDYLVKPFSARELLTRIRTHLELARVRRGVAAVVDHRNWLESILDLAPMPLLLLEPGTARVTFANKAADRIAGGKFPDGIPADRYHEVRAVSGERLDGVEMEWHTPAGTSSVLVFSDTLPEAPNHPATIVMAFQDVTRLKAIETELKAAVRVRDEFLSVASHELRTPLCALALQLGGLQKQLHQRRIESLNAQAVGKAVGKVDKAVKSTDRLSKLIDSLLDVSRIAIGRFMLNLEEMDLAELVREVTERFAEPARQAGCTLRVHVAPAAKGDWDSLRMEQVLGNLLSNAIKYAAGGPIDVDLEADAERVRLSVRDQGIGIPPEDVARIFGRFERAVTARHYGGLGLGLYITRQIVEAHGGQIRVTSAPRSGSTFTVEVPRQVQNKAHSLS